MPDDKEDSFQPKSLIVHSPDMVENIQRQMGVINFNQAFGNHNAWWECAMKIIPMVENAIEQEIIDLSKHPELKLNESAVYRLKKLWNGQCYITIEDRRSETEAFHYDEGAIDFSNPDLEIINVPALDQMDLTGKKSEKSLLLKINELMPLKYAWEGLSWATVIEYGNFKVQTQEGTIPTITKDDMESLTILTEDISRNTYNRIIKKQKNLFTKHWYTVYNNIHKIIYYMKIGIREEQASPYATKAMKGVA